MTFLYLAEVMLRTFLPLRARLDATHPINPDLRKPDLPAANPDFQNPSQNRILKTRIMRGKSGFSKSDIGQPNMTLRA